MLDTRDMASLFLGQILSAKMTLSTTRSRSRDLVSKSHQISALESRYIHASVERDYVVNEHRVLGKGYSGAVVVGTHRITGQECALKRYIKGQHSLDQLEHVRREVNIHLSIEHPHVARLLQVYETKKSLCLVLELCSGGELLSHLCVKRRFSEDEACKAAAQMLSALTYLHSRGIVHRDIKLENWLYADSSSDAQLKLIDFGFSFEWDGSTPMCSTCGTTCNMAPEVFQRNYTDKCDVWSFGVVLYALLTGKQPFVSESDKSTKEVVLDAVTDDLFTGPAWPVVSLEAQDFLRKVMCRNASLRLSALECADHPWLASHWHVAHSPSNLEKSPPKTYIIDVDSCRTRSFPRLWSPRERLGRRVSMPP